MPWYQGPPLLYHLEHVHIASDRNLIDVRFPVQWVIRPHVGERRRLPRLCRPGRRRRDARRRRGRRAARRPAHARSPAIDTFDGPVRGGVPADVRGAAPRATTSTSGAAARSCARTTSRRSRQLRVPALLDVRAAARARSAATSSSTRRARAMVGAHRRALPHRRRDAAPRRAARRRSSSTTSAACTCELSAPLVFDSYRRNRATGSLIVIDEATNETVAAGVILDTEVEEAEPSRPSERSPNVRWQGSRMTRERRWRRSATRGATLWFTGLPGAGKSTVAAAVEERLLELGPAGVPARRRQPAPRPQRRPRLRRARPRRERAPHRARRAAAGRVRHDRARQPRQPLRRRPRVRRRAARRRRARRSSRSSSTRRSSCASSATRRASTRARARASCRA